MITREQQAAIQRGQRWQAFVDEEGGIGDFIKEYKARVVERILQLEPWEVDKIAKLSMAAKVADKFKACIDDIVADGKVQQHIVERVAQIESIPARKRKLLGL